MRDGLVTGASRPVRHVLVETLENRTLMSAGTLDLSYGPGGRQTFNLNPHDRPDSVIHLGRRGFLIVGATGSFQDASPVNGFMLKYNADGSLDSHFGDGGKVLVATALTLGDLLFKATAAPGGKILLLEQNGPLQLLMRFTARGALDTNFGKGGIADLSADDKFDAIAAGADGKVVLGAADRAHPTPYPPLPVIVPVSVPGEFTPDLAMFPPPTSDFLVTRLRSDGTVDLTFGNGGSVETDFGYRDDVSQIVVRDDGKVVASGTWSTGVDGSYHPAIVRYNRDGKLDRSFGSGGKISSGSVAGGQAVFTSDGGFLLAGAGAIARYTHRGQLDAHFGTKGQTTLDSAFQDGSLIDRRPDGSIMLVTLQPTGSTEAVIRLHSNGRVDKSFGIAGIAMIHALPEEGILTGTIAVQGRTYFVQGVADIVNGKQDNDIRITAVKSR
ncbi:MAG: hypothetical protein JWN24_1636 [Phycisphaerales bacterium]|nr:hypothetical protein [Phycisphaerales bacterium]